MTNLHVGALGASFDLRNNALNRKTRQGGVFSLWGRGGRSWFSGHEGVLSLDGDVSTLMFGADYARGPLVVGLLLSHSRGPGDYAGVDAGEVASSVTGVYPWLGYKATDRITVWGVTGYGSGALRLTPEGGPTLKSDLSMAMAAAGTRGELVAGGADGFGLAFKADALWVGTAIDGIDGPVGRLAGTGAAVARVRTALEGSRGFSFGSGLSLRPSAEVGLRHDGGDAETGSGVDIGGGLIVSDPSTGLSAGVRMRMLLMHEAEGFRDRGVSVSLSYNPTPLGLTARVAPSWGARADWGRRSAVERRASVGAGGPRPPRIRRAPDRGPRLRDGGREPLRRHDEDRLRCLRDGARLSVGIQARRARRGGSRVRPGRRGRAPGAH